MTQPLDGLVIIDLSQIYNGPYATFLLATAGATVIKIEPPGGESLRRRGVVGGAALPFAMLNGCKQSIVLNLKTEDGKAALRDLVKTADVIVENFAPGTMDRLGLGYENLRTINPRLIYAASSGFGSTGPYKNYPAMDLTIQAMSGVMSTTGYADRPPVKAGPALCDFFAGVHLYGAITTALYTREKTGVAHRVEVAMQDAVYSSLSSSLGMHWAMQGKPDAPPPRTGNRHGGLAEAPYNVYPTSDGWIAIICVGEVHWRSMTKAMGRPELADDPRFTSLKERVAHMDDDRRHRLRVDENPKEAGHLRALHGAPRRLRAGARSRRSRQRSQHARARRPAAAGPSRVRRHHRAALADPVRRRAVAAAGAQSRTGRGYGACPARAAGDGGGENRRNDQGGRRR